MRVKPRVTVLPALSTNDYGKKKLQHAEDSGDDSIGCRSKERRRCIPFTSVRPAALALKYHFSHLYSQGAAIYLIFLFTILPPPPPSSSSPFLSLNPMPFFLFDAIKGSSTETCSSVNRNTAKSDVPWDCGKLPVIWAVRSSLCCEMAQ